MNGEMWPSSVIISAWISKPRPRDESDGHSVAVAVHRDADETTGRADELSSQSACPPTVTTSDNDDTIVVETNSSNMGCITCCDNGD